MKKFLQLFVAAALMFGAAACASGVSSPGTAAKQYAQYVADGQYEKFADGIYIDPATPAEEVEQGKAMIVSLIKEKGVKDIEEKGGLKSIEVVSEQISEDGQTATVELKYTYGNGETSDNSSEMRLDGGVWKMDLSK